MIESGVDAIVEPVDITELVEIIFATCRTSNCPNVYEGFVEYYFPVGKNLTAMHNLWRKKSVKGPQAEAQPDSGLKKALGAVDLTAIGIGAIVGAGIFVSYRKSRSLPCRASHRVFLRARIRGQRIGRAVLRRIRVP